MARRKPKDVLIKDFLSDERDTAYGSERNKIMHAQTLLRRVRDVLYQCGIYAPTIATLFEHVIVLSKHNRVEVRHSERARVVRSGYSTKSLELIQEQLLQQFGKKLRVVDERDQSRIVKRALKSRL